MSAHPLVKGQKVTCIRAPEAGIPIKEGQVYTVKSTFIGNQNHAEASIPELSNTPGIEVDEVGGWFTADRFQCMT